MAPQSGTFRLLPKNEKVLGLGEKSYTCRAFSAVTDRSVPFDSVAGQTVRRGRCSPGHAVHSNRCHCPSLSRPRSASETAYCTQERGRGEEWRGGAAAGLAGETGGEAARRAAPTTFPI